LIHAQCKDFGETGMNSNDTDKAWEYFGNTDPYFSVLTLDEYKKENFSSEGRKRFFESGAAYTRFILQVVRNTIAPSFDPTTARALDFGCGVGRLVIPLASICKQVVGVDISDAMLMEAVKNCEEFGISNVDLIKDVSQATGVFDFIHSYIVFQHISPKRGEAILKRMLDLLREDGVGVIHLTYHRKGSLFSRVRYWVYTSVPIPFLAGFWNLLKGRAFHEPIMQMNEYNMNSILRLLQESDCHQSLMRFTDHGSTYGVILFFQKKRLPLL
jgi:SAM-dependent methyltransferase